MRRFPERPRVSAGRRMTRFAGLILAAVLGSSCEPPPEREPFVDLVAEFPTADFDREVEMIDFGEREAAEALLSGWSWNEISGDGTSFVWGQGSDSVLEVFVSRPRDLDLELRAIAYPFEDGSPQTVEILVNDHPVSTTSVPKSWTVLRFNVRKEVLVSGINQFRFRYGRVAGGTNKSTSRRLALGVDWLRTGLTSSGAESPSDRREAGRRLVLPWRSRLDYYLELAAGATLALERVEVDNGSGARLEIEIHRDDPAAGSVGLSIVATDRDVEGSEWPLADESGLYRLRFAVSGPESGAGEIRLVEPRILAPRSMARLAEPRLQADSIESSQLRPRPNILLYSVDTLRADRLGAYGYENAQTPALDAFSREAILFERFQAQAPWTLPSMASVFTGLRPLEHGVLSRREKIARDLTTLAELLQDVGYETAGISANGFVSADFGFDQGFDELELYTSLTTRAEALQAWALEWLDTRRGAGPFFLFIHAIDPHDSYDPPEPFRPKALTGEKRKAVTREELRTLKRSGAAPGTGLLDRVVSLYDGEVSYADWSFGRLLEALDERDLYEETLVVFLSDHGEEFFEHGSWTHGHGLHGELLDVPMMIRLPGSERKGTRVSAPAQHVDLLPTLVGYLGLESVASAVGIDLLASAGSSTEAHRRSVLSYLGTRKASVLRDQRKLIAHLSRGRVRGVELFDLAVDPGETRDLAPTRPILAGFLTSLVRHDLATQRRQVASERATVDPETAVQLDALGYLDTAP